MFSLVLARDLFATSSTHHRLLAALQYLVVGGISISPPLHPRAEATGFSGDSDNNVAIVSRSSGTLGELLPPGFKFVATSSVGLSYSSGSNYITTNDLIFDFGNDVGKLTIARGALFSDSPNLAATRSNFTYQGTAATFINGMDSTPLSLTSFNFDVDNISSTSFNPVNPSPNGSYSLVASVVPPSTAVPEPFTIIGTIVGGTAAIRTRKKLKAAAKV